MERLAGKKEVANKEPSFEEIYIKLEKTVQKLDAGGLTLEESLSLYEEGIRLAKLCDELLDSAQLRIKNIKDTFKEVSKPEED